MTTTIYTSEHGLEVFDALTLVTSGLSLGDMVTGLWWLPQGRELWLQEIRRHRADVWFTLDDRRPTLVTGSGRMIEIEPEHMTWWVRADDVVNIHDPELPDVWAEVEP